MEKYIAPDRKRIPYGMMNFAVHPPRRLLLCGQNPRSYPLIEQADRFFFFIRPRRFRQKPHREHAATLL